MNRARTLRGQRLRHSALMIATVAGAIIAVPFMLMLLIARLGSER